MYNWNLNPKLRYKTRLSDQEDKLPKSKSMAIFDYLEQAHLRKC